jgi:DNA-binding CsgD family transcriptional regulator
MTAGRIEQLTDAQRACLRLVLTHHNSKEIAARFNVSPSAIDKRIERAVQILGVGTRFEAARRLQQHEQGGGNQSGDTLLQDYPPAVPPTYERLPSEAFDVPNPPVRPAGIFATEPWGLVRRFLGLSPGSGSRGMARNRVPVGDRLVRLVGLVGLIAITSMALVNMAMTLTTLLRATRISAAPIHGTERSGPTGRLSMLKQRRDATDAVTDIFLKAETAVDEAAMLAASCVSTLLQQRVAANLPVGTGTAALQLVSQASFDMINARQRFVEAHRALVDVRHDIGLGQFYGYGDTAKCPPNEGALQGAVETPRRLAAVA